MAEPIKWLLPPRSVQLRSDEVHVWRADFGAAANSIAASTHLLSDEEQKRAKQLVFEKDRSRFTASRSILRHLLARYLGCSAKDLEFAVGPMGKPALRGNPLLRFNLTHSDGLTLYAFSRGRELGIDVERQHSEFSNLQIVLDYFSTTEQAEFLALEPALQEEAFYLGWTRKEAYLKARGEGLRAMLKNFDVSLTRGQPVILRSEDRDRWEIYSFYPLPGFVGALAVEGKDCNLRFWNWGSSRL